MLNSLRWFRNAGAVIAGAVLTAGLVSPASASAAPDGLTGPLAGEMRQLSMLQPGGVQVSDNAMVWPAMGTIVVWPSPGERVAPKGLGNNVRRDVAGRVGVEELAGSSSGSDYSIQDVHGCPSGITVKDYYCFYTDSNWGGRRLQFTGATTAGIAANWGFDNQTSSWVNNDTDCWVMARDTLDVFSLMWQEPENSTSSLVSSAYNDKLSYWDCD